MECRRICNVVDEPVRAFRERALEGEYPYLWVDATYLKVRQNHRVVSMAAVVAIGVRESGEREILGFAVGASAEQSFWLECLRSLLCRGLQGVRPFTSDAQEGLKVALSRTLAGATWQRCRVHFMRNVLAHVTRADKPLVAAALRTIIAQPDRVSAGEQFRLVANILRDDEANVLALAYMAFHQKHSPGICPANPLERLNIAQRTAGKEIKRRTHVVGIFPDVPSVGRLVGPLLMDIHDEWRSAFHAAGAAGPLAKSRCTSSWCRRRRCARLPAPLHLEPVR